MNDTSFERQKKIIAKLKEFGYDNEDRVEELAEMIDSFSNLIIDMYLDGKQNTE